MKLVLDTEVGLSPGDFVLDGGPALLAKKGRSPRPTFYCGQTARCIKMPLGMEVGLSPGDFVFDGPSYPQKKMAHPPHPIFGPCLLWPNGWIHEDATWYGSIDLGPGHCIRRGPSYPRKGHSTSLFSAHVYCGHGRPSQLLLSSCLYFLFKAVSRTFINRHLDTPRCSYLKLAILCRNNKGRRVTQNSTTLPVFGRPLQITVRPVLWDRCPVCIVDVLYMWPKL